MIGLRGIERVFRLGGEEVHALRRVTLDIARGEYVSIMGPSGSGKSTLLNVVGLLDRPSAGRYELDGRDVTDLSDDEQARVRRERIGFVFQFFHLVPRLTAAQNIELPMVLAGIDPAERRERVARLTADYGLEARAHHRPDELSGGQCQRVAIARAMSMRPALILADEPTGNLDPANAVRMLELLADQVRLEGAACLLATHAEAATQRADRVIRLTPSGIVVAAAAS